MTRDALVEILQQYLARRTAQGIVDSAFRRVGASDRPLGSQVDRILDHIRPGVSAFIADPRKADEAFKSLSLRIRGGSIAPSATLRKMVFTVRTETDVVTARSEVRPLCREVGFTITEITKIATVVSELARNLVKYTDGGTLSADPLKDTRKQYIGVEVISRDAGPGIPNIEEIMSGQYRSKSGMGKGLLGVKKLMHDFDLDTGVGGTVITARRFLQSHADR